jgi:hypothetical protein
MVRGYFVLKGFVPALLGATDVLPIHRRRKGNGDKKKDTCVTGHCQHDISVTVFQQLAGKTLAVWPHGRKISP